MYLLFSSLVSISFYHPCSTSLYPPLPPAALLCTFTAICMQCHYRRYIEADFGFGYNLLPTSVDRVTEGPLQIALLRSSLSNWSSVVVCSDHVDLSMNNSEMFFLLSDFFGSYFWTDQFGHPGDPPYPSPKTDTSPSPTSPCPLVATEGDPPTLHHSYIPPSRTSPCPFVAIQMTPLTLTHSHVPPSLSSRSSPGSMLLSPTSL